MEEHSLPDRVASIESKLDLLVHHFDKRIHNDSPMEQGVLTDCGFWYQNDSLHEQKFPDLDAFEVNTSARFKNVESQMGHLVRAFKEQFSRTSPSNTSKYLNECMDTSLSNVQELPILKYVEESENELEIENKALLNNLENEEPIADKLKVEEESQVMGIEKVLVKIDTFTFPMNFVTWGIEGNLQNSHILRRPLPSLSQAWIDINKGELCNALKIP